jgi:hypothetical protein
MRQNLYTCCRCGNEQRTQIEVDDAPISWALITFQRNFVHTVEGKQQVKSEQLTTHACGKCCEEVLTFLEKVSPDLDKAFDHGGVS